jgi:predicted TIM-barrel fold metal-dependent hydrolase
MIIDAHMHVDDVPALGWSMSARECIARMDEAAIDVGIIMTITDLPAFNPDALELIVEACAAYPERLYAFCRIHPWYGDEAVRLLDRALSDYPCFKGLKLHPVSSLAHPSGKDTINLVRKAAEHNAPTLLHCGDEPMTTPLAIEPLAAACPEAKIILGHMGGYYHGDEAIEVAERNENIVLETSAFPYPYKIREAVDRIGADRVIYGSDGPVCSPPIEVEKVRLAGLAAGDEGIVLGDAAAALIGGVR